METVPPATYARWRTTRLGAVTERIERDLVLDFAGPVAGRHVLDVGCGDGTYALACAERGAQVVGVDMSEPMLEAARSRAVEHGMQLRLERGSATSLPFADGTFGLEMEQVDPQAQKVTVAGEDLEYDFLVIATGHRSANEAVPGLGPFDGPGHSLMSPREAEEAGEAWKRFLDDPGPMAIGSAPGASCLGPAYEFAFEVDHALKRQKRRHRVPIAFVTPEPFLGHFGVGGMGRGHARSDCPMRRSWKMYLCP